MRATQSIAALATDDSKAFTVRLPHRTVSRTEVFVAEDCSLMQSHRSALP
jgi:hypothetical protein